MEHLNSTNPAGMRGRWGKEKRQDISRRIEMKGGTWKREGTWCWPWTGEIMRMRSRKRKLQTNISSLSYPLL
jgi:hypothetical protein